MAIDPRRGALVVIGLMLVLVAWALTSHVPAASAAGDVNEGLCPNEGNTGFSSELPDCRAYEQVSPVYKDGFPFNLSYFLAGGERVQGFSLGLFAGAVGYTEGAFNEYGVVRTGGGWSTGALSDVPLSEFSYGGRFEAPILMDDEGASLIQLHPASGSVYERDLYVHEPSGSFVPVGPMLPPSAIPPGPTGSGEQGGNQPEGDYVAATPKLSHVLFTLQALSETGAPGVTSDLWPGDTTRLGTRQEGYIPSLYEYAGTGKTTPRLVGLDNDGQLISDCGTAPGGWDEGGNGNHLNVISEAGERVFFTAVGEGKPFNQACDGAGQIPPVDELFAREDGSHTVAISEPAALSPSAPEPDAGCSSTPCLRDITETANFRDANFEKASKNGLKVFFSSTQQLLNGATQDGEASDSAVPRTAEKGCQRTTAGENGCNLYEYDFEEDPGTGKPVGLVLVSNADSPGVEPQAQGVAAVSEDGSHVYFLARGVLTHEPRAAETGACIAELSPAETVVEESTKEGRCRPKRGAENLYVYNTTSGGSSPEFVATLTETDDAQWTFNAGGNTGQPMDVTDDGRFLVFTSTEHLLAGDASTVQQVFRYEAATGTLVRVSLGDEGHDGLGAATIGFRKSAAAGSPEPVEGDAHPAISEDGATVVFESSEALTPGALSNECAVGSQANCVEYAANVYEYREGHLYLISHGGATSEAPVISQSGRDIFFSTTEPLVAQDTDTLPDLYDARAYGGFTAPASQAPCGDDCQGQVPVAPVFAAPGTASVSAGSNLAPPSPATPTKTVAKKKPNNIKCKKGVSKRHGKCANKRKVKRKARAKKTDAERRARS